MTRFVVALTLVAGFVSFVGSIQDNTWAESPAIRKMKTVAATTSDDADAARAKRIKSLMASTMRSFSSAKLTVEQKQQADALLGKAVKNFVTKRAEALITDELQKKYASCLREAQGQTAKERASWAFACAGFTAEQIKVFESTQKSLDKAKRDFAKSLTETQIAGLPKTIQKSIKSELP